MERLKTGISGLDKILEGFPVGRTVLVTGDPGTGKTIFGLQFANISCSQGLKTVFISTEENAGDLRFQGQSFFWDLEGHEKSGTLSFIELADNRAREIETSLNIHPDAVKENFVEILDHLPEDTDVLVLDSLGSHTANLTPYEFKDRFDLLAYKLSHRNITAIIVLDSATSKEFKELALFSAHGAIKLQKRENPYTGMRERVMDIVKMRNTMTPIQLITYQISSKGIDLISPIELIEDDKRS